MNRTALTLTALLASGCFVEPPVVNIGTSRGLTTLDPEGSTGDDMGEEDEDEDEEVDSTGEGDPEPGDSNPEGESTSSGGEEPEEADGSSTGDAPIDDGTCYETCYTIPGTFFFPYLPNNTGVECHWPNQDTPFEVLPPGSLLEGVFDGVVCLDSYENQGWTECADPFFMNLAVQEAMTSQCIERLTSVGCVDVSANGANGQYLFGAIDLCSAYFYNQWFENSPPFAANYSHMVEGSCPDTDEDYC